MAGATIVAPNTAAKRQTIILERVCIEENLLGGTGVVGSVGAVHRRALG
jgi:hypothetical protein